MQPQTPATTPEPDLDAQTASVQRLIREGLISTAAAARPLSAAGQKNLTACTIARWATEGVHAADGTVVKLESVRLGGRLKTSEAAVLRFVVRLQGGAPTAAAPTVGGVEDPSEAVSR